MTRSAVGGSTRTTLPGPVPSGFGDSTSTLRSRVSANRGRNISPMSVPHAVFQFRTVAIACACSASVKGAGLST